MNGREGRSRTLTFSLLLGMLCIGGAGLVWSGQSGAPTLDERVKMVASQLRCPVCHGESVYDSPVALAGNMRGLIRSMLKAGESDSQVENYFVARYGQWILLAPPVSGIGLLAWLGPPLLLVLGLPLLISSAILWRRNRRRPTVDAGISSAEDADSAMELLTSRFEAGEISLQDLQAGQRQLAEARHRSLDDWSRSQSRPRTMHVAAVVAASVGIASLAAIAYNPVVSATPATNSGMALASGLVLVRNHPHSTKDWLLLGLLQLQAGHTKSAVASYETAVRLEPRNAAARLDLAYVLIGERHAHKSLRVLGQVEQARPDDSQLWLLEGLARQQLHQKQAAVVNFRRYLALTPRSALAPTVMEWIVALKRD